VSAIVCGECRFWRRCPYCGASPQDVEGNTVVCSVLASTRRGVLVSVPAVQAIRVEKGPSNGDVVSVQTRLVLFRRSMWRRLFGIP